MAECQTEMLDIVDEHDNVIGREQREVVIRETGFCFRTVNIFLKNSENKLWIPRRSPQKSIFPSGLDVSAGGFVQSGESYEMALARELKEELNLELSTVTYQLIGYLDPQKYDVSSFMKVYEVQHDNSPQFNRNDFVEGIWLLPNDVLNRISKEKHQPKSDLAKLISIFYTQRKGILGLI